MDEDGPILAATTSSDPAIIPAGDPLGWLLILAVVVVPIAAVIIMIGWVIPWWRRVRPRWLTPPRDWPDRPVYERRKAALWEFVFSPTTLGRTDDVLWINLHLASYILLGLTLPIATVLWFFAALPHHWILEDRRVHTAVMFLVVGFVVPVVLAAPYGICNAMMWNPLGPRFWEIAFRCITPGIPVFAACLGLAAAASPRYGPAGLGGIVGIQAGGLLALVWSDLPGNITGLLATAGIAFGVPYVAVATLRALRAVVRR